MTVSTKRKVVMESDVSESSGEEEEVGITNSSRNGGKVDEIEDEDCVEEEENSAEEEDEEEDESVDDEEEESEKEIDGDELNDVKKKTVQTKKASLLNDSENETDSDKESSENEGEENDEDLENQNIAWADSIANILKTNKPKTKKTLVLSKAKKLTDARKDKPKPAGFEVEKVDGEIKEEQIEPEDKEETEPPRKKKKEIPSIRKKPNILEKDREKTLMKIATKGVVQLFNAVRNQQKEIDAKLKEAGPLDVKKEKVLKSINKQSFLEKLENKKSQIVDSKDLSMSFKSVEKDVDDTKTTWDVLRDDFMMGGKMKNWDKELEEEDDEMEVENEMESD